MIDHQLWKDRRPGQSPCCQLWRRNLFSGRSWFWGSSDPLYSSDGSVLHPGDIAIIGCNADNGWKADNMFRGNAGAAVWNASSALSGKFPG
jgi:hypothetical protein